MEMRKHNNDCNAFPCRYKGGAELVHGEHYRMMFDDMRKTYSLTVLDAYAEDSGLYRCVCV